MERFYCTNKSCPNRFGAVEMLWRDCGNKECCKTEGSHYPACVACSQIMTHITSAPGVIWTGNITRRYRDPKRPGYHGDSFGEDGFWAYTRNTPDKKPQAVRIENWQQVRDYCRQNGCADPREIGSMNSEISEDGKSLQCRGTSGSEV